MSTKSLLESINYSLEVIENEAEAIKGGCRRIPPSAYVPPPFVGGPGTVKVVLSCCHIITEHADRIRKELAKNRTK